PKPTATPVVEAKVSAAVGGGETVKIAAWTIGPDAPSFYRRDNLISAAESLNQELEKEGSGQRVQVEATFESGGQWADYKQKFILASEARQGPDIILAGHEDLAPWAAAGHIIELDPLLKKYEARFADVIPGLWESVKLTGKTYAIPQDTEARPIYYRKDLLAKLGWPRDRIDGLAEAVKKGEFAWPDLVATAREAVDKKIVEPGKGWYHRPAQGADFYSWYYMNGGEMQDKESGKLVLVKDALSKHYQIHADAVRTSGITPANMIGMEGRLWHETVTSGKVLFYNAGTWTWKDWQATYKVPEQDLWENVGFTLVPAAAKGARPVTLSHPLVYMVSANSKSPELAFRVLAHATTPELNSKHAVQSAHLAILKSQANDPTYQQDKFLLQAGYMLDYTTFIPNHPRFGQYDEVLFRLLAAVESGQMQPGQAADVAVDELRAQLKDQLILK
ncbi:MAG: extracellular solute-binding protein, partial [Chloroflexota bacterium]|nr:extracellular solute-binding protein [Chloroflexota bacterium]